MEMRYTGRRLVPPTTVSLAAMPRTSPRPAKPQAVHNLFFNVDVTRYPNIQRLLDERVGPQWNGIRQLMTMPLADASTLQLPTARLYVFTHHMVMNLLTCDQTLSLIERELSDGRWRS